MHSNIYPSKSAFMSTMTLISLKQKLTVDINNGLPVSLISAGRRRPKGHRLPPDDQQPGSVRSRSRIQPQILSLTAAGRLAVLHEKRGSKEFWDLLFFWNWTVSLVSSCKPDQYLINYNCYQIVRTVSQQRLKQDFLLDLFQRRLLCIFKPFHFKRGHYSS